MSTIFDSIATRTLPQSVFDMSHEVKLSFNMGELIPTYLEEVLPGDTWQVQSSIMIRLAPMLAPVMHRVKVFTHYFYVPNRLVWNSWNDHIRGGDTGTENPPHPYVQASQNAIDSGWFAKGSLADYLGVPTWEPGSGVPTDVQFLSALPFRAYQLIYDEYYRDEHLSAKTNFSLGDGTGPDAGDPTMVLRTRHWERDYFTSARPSALLGDVNVQIPMDITYKNPSMVVDAGTGQPTAGLTGMSATDGIYHRDGVSTAQPSIMDNIDSASTTVEDERRANRLQEWLELAQRGGNRINEIIRNFFGETPDDLRLSRPKYLGGGVQNVVMSEVLNTAGDVGSTLQPLGEYGGHGVSVGNSNQFTDKFKEHGYVMGITSVIPATSYQQGLHRHWTKFDKYEKYWPQFANIGEQEIKQKEIFFNPFDTSTNQERTFGYAPRYAEYKYACNRVAGDFRKDQGADNLSYWHMGRYFETEPALNEDFVKADPTHRIFAVSDETVDKLYCQIFHKARAKRKMPYHNIPSNMPII